MWKVAEPRHALIIGIRTQRKHAPQDGRPDRMRTPIRNENFAALKVGTTVDAPEESVSPEPSLAKTVGVQLSRAAVVLPDHGRSPFCSAHNSIAGLQQEAQSW